MCPAAAAWEVLSLFDTVYRVESQQSSTAVPMANLPQWKGAEGRRQERRVRQPRTQESRAKGRRDRGIGNRAIIQKMEAVSQTSQICGQQ